MSLFLLFCCWSGREREKMKNKWTSWHFSCSVDINRFPAGGCTYKAAKGWVCRWMDFDHHQYLNFPVKIKYFFIEKILSSAKQSWQITKFFPASYPGVDLKIFFAGLFLVESYLDCEDSQHKYRWHRTGLLSVTNCFAEYPSQALFGNSQSCFMDKIDRFGSHLYKRFQIERR